MTKGDVCTECGNCHDCKLCSCAHHKILPGAILLIAVLFLLKALDVISAGTLDVLWPIVLGLAMLMKLSAGKCKCYRTRM